MASRKTEFAKCFVVRHPDHCAAYVVADNWEQATVKAAEFWGVPWASVVFDCELEKTMEARRGVCSRCRRIIYSNRELCDACRKVLETEEKTVRERMKKTWYLGKKNEVFGA